MASEDDDPLRAEAPCGDHSAQSNCTVADDGHRLPGTGLGRERGVVARRHDVREREQRRHQLVVRPHRQHDERAVRLRDPDGLTLAAVDAVEAVPAPVEARGVQPFAAEHAGSVRPHERRHHEVADLHRADLGADVLDDADELVAHSATGLGVLHLVVRPEIAPADRGAGEPDEGIGRLD